MAEQQEILLGNAFVTDKGNWQQGAAYETNDIVHTQDGIFLSLVDNNATQPSASAEGWKVWLDKTPVNDSITQFKALMDAFGEANQFCGFARQNGAASGDAETSYGSKALLHKIGKHFHLMTVKDGVPQHICVGGRLTKATNGDDIAIDGSDGDVVLGVDMEGLQILKATKTVNDKETNVIGIGMIPAYWQNVASKRLPKFAITPVETVNCQLEGDVRSQAHCIYNTDKAGSYTAPHGVFKASYKTAGGGYPSQNVSCVDAISNAQKKNADALSNRPYMGMYYEFYEAFLALFYAEIGSLKHTQPDLFGTGLTPTEVADATTFYDDAISAVSGWKILTPTPSYSNVWGNEAVTVGSTKRNLVGGVAGESWYGVVECLEGQRVLDGIAKAGFISKIGSKANIFSFDASGNIVCTSDGSINPADGTGMTVNKHYYVVRGVPGCEGMADGVMTAVVNSYTLMEFADGVKLTSGSVDLTGKRAILKRSIPVYRGFTLPYIGLFRQMDGAFLVAKVDNSNNISMEFRCAASYEDIKPRKTFGYEAAVDGEADIEKGLSQVYKYPARQNNEYWVSKCDYNLSLFCATAFSGGTRTHENMYIWMYDTNNVGKGKRQVHGSVVGCALAAWPPRASVRSVHGNYHAGFRSDYYAGAFAVLLQ